MSPYPVDLSSRQQQLIDDLRIIEDPQERLGAVVDHARRGKSLSDQDRTESNRVQGCQSHVWLTAQRVGETWFYSSDSDSPLVKGLVRLICDFFSGETASHILANADACDPVALLDFSRNLSPTRINGLAAVRRRLRELVVASAPGST
ncbi:MAG: SufE family protein [Opitutaceae bacterium]|nr:SufE family protein [Opitutaceae bacterium]